MALRFISYTLLSLMPPALAAAADPSPFDGIPGIRFDSYDVEGTTAAAIYASMHARGPRGDDGEAVARTTWRLRVGWQELHRGSDCQASNPLSSLTITVLLPRLKTRAEDVTPDGLAFWRRSLIGMQIHEAGHARIAYDHRDDFTRLASDMRCDRINALAERVKADISALQSDYDRTTRHGLSQVPAAASAP